MLKAEFNEDLKAIVVPRMLVFDLHLQMLVNGLHD